WAGSDHNHSQLRILPQKFSDRLHRIRRKSGFKNEHVSRKFGYRGLRLRQRLGLSHNPDVIFQREDLPQASAENRLGIGHNDADELSLPAFACSEIFFYANRSASHGSLVYARSK